MFSSLSFEACTIAALPTPTQIAAAMGVGPVVAMASSESDAITSPTRFDVTLRTKPPEPPPTTKNEAQAMKVTHTGTGKTVAVM